MHLRHLLGSLLISSVLAAPLPAFAQDAPYAEEPSEEDIYFEDESDYQSPAFQSDREETRKIPVKGNSEFSFNPATGLYEHTPQNLEGGGGKSSSDPVSAYRGPTASQEDVDPYLEQAGIEDDNGNSRGIRNVMENKSKRSNVDAYREMMGVEPEEDVSADDYEMDRRYLKNSRRYSDGRYADEPRGVSSGIFRDRYADDEDVYYEDNHGRRGIRNNDSRRIAEPKTGNIDAYREMMGEIEGQ